MRVIVQILRSPLDKIRHGFTTIPGSSVPSLLACFFESCNDFSLLPMFNVFLMQKMKRKGGEEERKELIAAINSPLLSFQLHECREYLKKKKINNESFIVLMDSIVAAFNGD